MHRCCSGFLTIFAVFIVIALTGCLGKNSANPGNSTVQSVSISPGPDLSLDAGGTQVFSAAGKNANGGTVLGGQIQFLVSSGNPNSAAPLSIASNGAACAGNWDPTSTQCNPGTPGIAIVTAVISGVSSPPTTVYVHRHIDSVQITQAEAIPPQFDCFSQGQTWQFQGIAYSNNVDITNTVGPMSWTYSNTGVLTPDTTVNTLQPNQVQVTAMSPGVTQLFATVGGATSVPYPFTTCLVQYIRLQIGGQGPAGNSITLTNGGSVNVTATVVDTLGYVLSSPPLTWSTTNPEVAAFSTTTSNSLSNSAATRNNLGGATLFASCTPPSCNIGVQPGLPIYASDGLLPNGEKGYSAIAVDVTSTAIPPTYSAWAATTGCVNQVGCTSAMFSVAPGVNPIGSIISVPRTPNSMMFNHLSAARVYLGSDQGLMYVDITSSAPAVALVSNASTPCNASLCGKVLTISNDGNLVVVSDTVSTPSQVYIYNAGTSGTAPIDLILSTTGETATAAAFSPDQLKLFILTNLGNMYVYSTVDSLSSVPIATTATDVKFSADGSFAYVSGAPAATSISGYSTCGTPTTDVVSTPFTTTYPTLPPLPNYPPYALYPLPVLQLDSQGNTTEKLLALDPPNVDTFEIGVTQTALQRSKFVCNPPTVQLVGNSHTSVNLGQGAFTPIDAQVVGDGTAMIIVGSKLPAVLMFNIANGTTTSIPLVGNPDPLSASASSDGSQVYVAACDQYASDGITCTAASVHIVNTISQGDLQQVPYVNINENNNPNMCNGQGTGAPLCVPDLIAIKPQ